MAQFTPHLDDQQVFQYVSCSSCESYKYFGATREDPAEHICEDGDFGQDKPCAEILGAIERGIEDNAFDTSDGYLAEASYCKETENEIAFNVDWETHKYWWVPYTEGDPIGYDTLEEVWKELFV